MLVCKNPSRHAFGMDLGNPNSTMPLIYAHTHTSLGKCTRQASTRGAAKETKKTMLSRKMLYYNQEQLLLEMMPGPYSVDFKNGSRLSFLSGGCPV